MGTPLQKNFAAPAENTYGVGPWFNLYATLVGAGNGNAPTVGSVSGVNPPGNAEIVQANIVRNSAGNYTITLQDAYYAVINWNTSIDDLNGSTPLVSALGQFKNLGCNPTVGTPGTPMSFVLTTYNTSFANADVALGTPIRLSINFKKDPSGASA
jgi:hypothetical protein